MNNKTALPAAFYAIDIGDRSVVNGAKAPVTFFFKLAKLLDTGYVTGNGFGDDYIKAPDTAEDRAAAEALMDEEKVIWRKVDKLPHHLSGYL